MSYIRSAVVCLAVCLVAWAQPGFGQGVTTGSIAGNVTDNQQRPVAGASVIAIHEPSGTTYEGTTRADGRFSILGMRVGGPYTVTVNFVGTGNAFEPKTVENVTVNLGTASDLNINVTPIAVQEQVTVTATVDPVFSSERTGASTTVGRMDIATLPTISARISDITRLTPQASGNSFAGQDNRLNNITVDGSYFNNSFGLGGQPGDRTNVAPISLESIEQVQVSIAPYDVRQGNFLGAAVNTVTRSGTNQFSGSFYHRMRSNDFVGTEAAGLTVNPGTFTFRNTGGWASAPILKNKWFVFGNYENEKDVRPISTFRANTGGEPVSGSVTRVLASDLTTLSAFLKNNFSYDTGPFQDIDQNTPAKRYLLRSDFNLNNNNKINFRYNQLDSSSDTILSSSSSAGLGRQTRSSSFLNFAASNYSILENIKSSIGEWNSVIGNSVSNNFIAGYTKNDESRGDPGKLFPFVDILGTDGTAYTSFGTEPFTPNNELRYNTLQMQDNLTKFMAKHSLTVGGTLQRYRSENVFFSLSQSAYTYNSLQDFYTDAQDFLANPNRTTSAVTLRRFQVRYNNIPGQDKPLQPLRVWYGGAYVQDEWRPRTDLSVTAGFRFDVPSFGNTGYDNPNADALTFRDETGSAVSYNSGKLPDANLLWSPRVGFNWDVAGKQRTQVRGGTGVFTGPPLYVWISNQIGQTGLLTGFDQIDNTTARPFNPDPNRYKPTNVTGAGAASYELDVTDPSFKFPQVWRTNIAVDQRVLWGMTATGELLYNHDVNGIYYINANLPAAQSTFSGVDNRPRWVGVACGTGTVGPCVNRINNAPGNQVTSTIAMKNESVGRSWNASASLSRPVFHGISFRGGYSFGLARNTIDPGSTAFSSWQLNQTAADPNNPGLGYSNGSQGHRVFLQSSFTRSYFGFGATTLSAFYEARAPQINFSTNASYVFAGDMNGDGAAGNDLIYIPRNTSEMNFVAFTQNGITFTADQQAQAFESYIQQDTYLRDHRGQYAERGTVFFPLFNRVDLSVVQDVFKNIGGKRNGGQVRLDFTNFGNLLNHNWGVSERMVVPLTQANGAQLLTSPGVDAQGRPTYRLAVVNNQLVSRTFQTNTLLSDVYQFMISFRYSFN